MTPQEFSQKITESTEHERLQVFMLQRIAGYLNVIKWGVGLACLLLFFLLLTLSK